MKNKTNKTEKKSHKEYMKMWRLQPKPRLREIRRDAKNRNLPFKLTYEEFLTFWQKPCYYCGDKIITVGLDRVDNDLGYQLDNLVPCCILCNRFKRRTIQGFFIEHCMKIAKNLGGF